MSNLIAASPEDTIRAIEFHQEQYIAHLRHLHDLSTRNPGITAHRPSLSGSTASGTTAAVRAPAITFQTDTLGQVPSNSGSKKARRLTDESQDQRRLSGQGRPQPPSTNDSDSDDDGDEFAPPRPSRTFSIMEPPMTYVKGSLMTEMFSRQGLADHLRSMNDTNTNKAALDHIWLQRDEINQENVLSSFEPDEDSPYSHAIYEVYEVGRNGIAKHMNRRHGGEDGEALDTSTVWDTISRVNEDGDAVGRMTIFQEPSPLMLGAAHMTMKKHFDMDELFQHLVSKDKWRTRAYMNRAYESSPLRQRTFFFVFKYYTMLAKGLKPPPWLEHDARPDSPDHIDIVECSSVLALSLEGDHPRTIKQKIRKGGKFVRQKGSVYNTFSPWHLLNIQSFPDNNHSLRDEELEYPFYSGPYAFLDCLGMEYKDAVKRNMQLNESITNLITPDHKFMFDSKLRDGLLFENAQFTYSRRYFWAYNTLGVINDGIKSMCKAYNDSFTREFWAGEHETLWPHPNPDSRDGLEYAKRMQSLREELESAVADLEVIQKKNEKTRNDIHSLREQLFSGSSVKESRRAIEQGDNIKVLTGLSMIFLPLTFVTGVFSITSVQIPTSNWRFPVTTVAVCVPFFFLVFLLQTQAGTAALKRSGVWFGEVREKILGTAARNRTSGSGGGGAGGSGALLPVFRRTQSSLGTQLNRRGTGMASLAGDKGREFWSRIWTLMPWGGGKAVATASRTSLATGERGGGNTGTRTGSRWWGGWWRRRHKPGEGASTELSPV